MCEQLNWAVQQQHYWYLLHFHLKFYHFSKKLWLLFFGRLLFYNLMRALFLLLWHSLCMIPAYGTWKLLIIMALSSRRHIERKLKFTTTTSENSEMLVQQRASHFIENTIILIVRINIYILAWIDECFFYSYSLIHFKYYSFSKIVECISP